MNFRTSGLAKWNPTILFFIHFALILPVNGTAQQIRDEESNDYFKRWLEQDVLYIITPEERDVFLALQTDDEREQFIEQFWLRRDPDLRTEVNEFKEEHFRRIAYANENFASGAPGWKTDRGMIYIKFGPPDRRETNPSGGTYERPSWEGGGWTSTFPFERWEYNYIEGIGQDIEIEFVDKSMTGEYRLTTDADDKDALLGVPNAGLTTAEALGQVAQKVDRIVKKASPVPGTNPLIVGQGRLKDQPFEKLQLMSDLQKPPALGFSDLKTQLLVDVQYNQLPLQVHSAVFPFSPGSSRVILSVYVGSRDLSLQKQKQLLAAKLDVFATVKTVSGEVVRQFEDSLAIEISENELGRNEEKFLYQKELFLEPGLYKFELVAKDIHGETTGFSQSRITVPRRELSGLTLSSILLAQRIQFLPGDNSKASQRFKIWPLAGTELDPNLKKLGFYFEIYDYLIDQSTLKPRLDVRFEILSANGETEVVAPDFRTVDYLEGQIRVLSIISLEGVTAGDHFLKVHVVDEISGDEVQSSAAFSLPERPMK